MGRPGRQKRSGPCWLVTDLVSDGDKGKQSAVYPAVAGISVQAVAALRSGSAGAWTVPPGGLRFHQLALPLDERGAKGLFLCLLFLPLLPIALFSSIR